MPASLPRPNPSTGELSRPVNIPPRPSLLIALQHEIAKKDPHIKKIGVLLSRDPAIAGNLLSIANSAMFNLHRRIKTVEEAITVIGLNRCSALATSLMAKRTLARGPIMMPRFWDVSEKRSWAMTHVALKMKIATPELAHHFGLFSDIGIPLMMASFPSYPETLRMANRMESDGLTQLENARHKINHALVGAMLAEHWHIDGDIVQAIRKHHVPATLADNSVSSTVRGLIAAHLLVDRAIQEHRKDISTEWTTGGALAVEMLGLSEADVRDVCEELKQRFLHPYDN
jgi:HD-like signal output (HDOD) protein